MHFVTHRPHVRSSRGETIGWRQTAAQRTDTASTGEILLDYARIRRGRGEEIMQQRLFAGLVCLALALGGGIAHAQQNDVHHLKLAHFIPATHIFAKYLQRWTDDLRQKSNGRLDIAIFPDNEMGPTPVYFDLARNGVADISWFLSGATRGRFPLTELIQLPYTAGSSEIGTQVLNDPELMNKYLGREYQGVKVLYLLTTQPGNLFTGAKPVRRVEDLKGMRIRYASDTIQRFVAALGATPVGVPPTGIADSLQKGTIDGVFTDYGGAYTAFHLGGLIKNSTEIYGYVSSFGVVMNPHSYDQLPPDLQKLITESTKDAAKPIGQLWDAADAPGKQYLVSEGASVIGLTPEEDAKFKTIGKEVAEKEIADLEAKHLPARETYDLMRQLAAKYAKTSYSFWKQ
jgi:TRAP-type transport system periplasmic protein